jgi:NhaA family Na+:H+ antiporter
VSDASPPAATAVAEFGRYLRTETTGGIIVVVATTIALIRVNSPLGDVYRTIRDF